MDKSGAIVGTTTRQRSVDQSPPPLPSPPMNTSLLVQQLVATSFPPGSPNLTVSQPWVKHGDLCDVRASTADCLVAHHFQDTVYQPTNDVCRLPPGLYTWTLTTDRQLSFARYLNDLEWGTKHANLALARPCWVAGELMVLPDTASAQGNVYWNLLSGTYSIPISQSLSPPDDPFSYLNNVLYPSMQRVWDGVPCAPIMHYQNWEFFPEATASVDYVAALCANNYFAIYDDALTWAVPPAVNTSVCSDWSAKTCTQRMFS